MNDLPGAKTLWELTKEPDVEELQSRIRALEAEIAIARERLGPAGYKIIQELALARKVIKDAEQERIEWVRRCESVEVKFNDATIENIHLRNSMASLMGRHLPDCKFWGDENTSHKYCDCAIGVIFRAQQASRSEE